MKVAPNNPPEALVLAPGHAVALPAKQLSRVFLGLGWREGATAPGKVDVDCACVSFDEAGNRDDSNTVWYRRLRNEQMDPSPAFQKAGGSSIVHTGDVLSGGAKGGDLERIFVALASVPARIMTLAFEANIFTDGYSFSMLESAYIRLVNADTNQELARLELSNGPFFATAAVLFVKLGREAGGNWSLDCAVESRRATLNQLPPHQPDMAARGVFAPLPGSLPIASRNPLPVVTHVAAPPPQLLPVQVPPGVVAGQFLSILAPNGQMVQVQCPPGLMPGQVFHVAMPAAQPAALVAVAQPHVNAPPQPAVAAQPAPVGHPAAKASSASEPAKKTRRMCPALAVATAAGVTFPCPFHTFPSTVHACRGGGGRARARRPSS